MINDRVSYDNKAWIGYPFQARTALMRLDHRKFPMVRKNFHLPLWMQLCYVHGEASSRGSRLHRNNHPVK